MSTKNENDNLLDKQLRFVEEYVVDFNGARAARDSGYDRDTAHVQAHKLLQNPNIKAAVKKHMSEVAERCFVNRAWIEQALLENYHRAMQATQVLDKAGNPTGFYEYDGGVANKTLELLGKMIGAYTDQVSIIASTGVIVLPSNGFEKRPDEKEIEDKNVPRDGQEDTKPVEP